MIMPADGNSEMLGKCELCVSVYASLLDVWRAAVRDPRSPEAMASRIARDPQVVPQGAVLIVKVDTTRMVIREVMGNGGDLGSDWKPASAREDTQ